MRRKHSGVTLVELMITVGIVGILAAVAYPSYQAQVRRGNRTEGKAELLEAAQDLEKCYTRFGSYISNNCVARTGMINGNFRASEAGRYRITLQNGATADAYVLQAVPQAGQAMDTCGTLTLDQSGLRSSATPADTQCW